MKAFLAEGMALTGDIDGALQLINEVIAQIERPGWGERVNYAEVLRLKGWMFSLKGGRRRNRRSCVPRPPWHGCGRAEASTGKRMSCLPRLTSGSPKASTPRICLRRRCYWTNSALDGSESRACGIT